ncbi:disulfide bond formation protein B [bacterium NHP-B]|nr:disulfide bond formation protein B [bacterium NHP-B]
MRYANSIRVWWQWLVGSNPQLLLIIGMTAGGGFIAALVWEWLGAVPCAFCKLERTLLALVALTVLLGQGGKKYTRDLLAVVGFMWLALCVVFVRHIGIQYRLFSLPKACLGTLPSHNVLEMERFLSHKPQASCDQMDFLFLGLPPTVYLLALCVVMVGLCFWGFLRHDKA